jgi:hypothetical protein
MTQQPLYSDIDKQASELSNELSSLNSRLHNKPSYYSPNEGVPRNRQYNKQDFNISQNSTNITNSSNNHDQLTARINKQFKQFQEK